MDTKDTALFILMFSTQAAEIRTKLAYILFVTGEDAAFDTFYKKGLREAKKCQLKGYGLYERKLLESIKAQFENSSAK